jgi:hypothetical protein
MKILFFSSFKLPTIMLQVAKKDAGVVNKALETESTTQTLPNPSSS